ncbi:MAG: DUF2089 domain-containing protein [Acholeplasmataceae bacterium]
MKAKYPVISTCPVCNHELKVVKLECDHCGTAIEGDFTLSKFNYMNQEKLYFIEIFIKNRGNIKAIEKELNISYPTVKKMLDDVINELGYDANLDFDHKEDEVEVVNEKIQSKAEVVKKLKNKEISALEAVELLKKIK